MIKYLFKGKIQIGQGKNSNWGFYSPRKETGDNECYKHMLCFGTYYICWGEK